MSHRHPSPHVPSHDSRPNSRPLRATKLKWLAVALLASLSFATGDSSAQSPASPRKAARPTGTIAGRVTARGKGLPDLIVTVRSAAPGGSQSPPQTKTDADGNYRLTDVPMDSYLATPVAPVYVVPTAGARRR